MTELKLPELGENIVQGTITKILVKTGDTIKKGQNILELETDKAVLEVPSSADGIVSEILIKSGTVVKVGQAIFKIEGNNTSKEIASSPKAAFRNDTIQTPTGETTQENVLPTRGHVLQEQQNVSRAPASVRQEDPGPLPSDAGLSVKVQPTDGIPPKAVTPQGNHSTPNEPLPIRKDIPAAPSVRLLARELGIDIGLVSGSGPNGRISIDDVKAYCKMIITSPTAGGAGRPIQQALPNFAKWGTVQRTPMNNVRKKTAEHLSHAWNSIPHVTQFDKVDITELEKLRKNFSGSNKKISITPFIIKVAATALKKFPQFNSSIDMETQEIISKDYVNIGVAVDTDRGLIVPVLKNVDKMSILQISDELSLLAQRARERKLTIEEMQGGCFTISNLGGIGGTCFTPIVNWPEVAILGVSRGSIEPIYIDGQFVPRLMLTLSLSYDHRIIDGADGARFNRWLCDAIQQPFLLELNK